MKESNLQWLETIPLTALPTDTDGQGVITPFPSRNPAAPESQNDPIGTFLDRLCTSAE